MTNLNIIKKRLQLALENTGHFEILSKEMGVPLVAFRLKKVLGDDGKERARQYTEYEVRAPGAHWACSGAGAGRRQPRQAVCPAQRCAPSTSRLAPRPCPQIADRLRMRGWVLPAYTMPANAKHVTLLRVTIREDLSMQMVDQLVRGGSVGRVWLPAAQLGMPGQRAPGAPAARAAWLALLSLPSAARRPARSATSRMPSTGWTPTSFSPRTSCAPSPRAWRAASSRAWTAWPTLASSCAPAEGVGAARAPRRGHSALLMLPALPNPRQRFCCLPSRCFCAPSLLPPRLAYSLPLSPIL